MLRANTVPLENPSRSNAPVAFGRRFFLPPLALLILTGCAPRRTAAQFIGYNAPQTNQQTLATNTACTGAAQNFPVSNFGQIAHVAQLVTIGTAVQQIHMTIQGSTDGLHFQNISDDFSGGGAGSGAVAASNYYAVVQVVVTCLPVAANSNFSLSYTGIASTSNPQTGIFLRGSIDKQIFGSAPANASLSSSLFQTPFGNSSGVITLSFSAAGPAGSSLAIQCFAQNSSNESVSFTFALGTGSNQVFMVPAIPCSQYDVLYTSGGASAQTFTVEYLFTLPGSPPLGTMAVTLTNPLNFGVIGEKGPRWQQVNVPAAGSQATASKAAGTNNTRHVADCVTVSAGAATAPVATILTVNLRDGASGAGTIIWSTTIAAPAATGQHGAVAFCGLNLIGSVNTAMTLEFSASLASEQESVTLTGYDVQ